MDDGDKDEQAQADASAETVRDNDAPSPRPEETGGPQGPEPTRFGDWERKGRCVDF